MNDEARRPGHHTGNDGHLSSDHAGSAATTDDTEPARQFAAGLRRRRAASWRCPPLPCGRRDPFDPLDPPPSGFGLSGIEVAAEVARLRRSGWLAEEIADVLGVEA